MELRWNNDANSIWNQQQRLHVFYGISGIYGVADNKYL